MEINLKDPAEFTLENICEYVRSGDDSPFNQIKVTKYEYAYFSQDYGLDYDSHQFCLETYCPGNCYVGEGAANDDEWVKEVYNTLGEAWYTGRRRLINY